MVQEENLIYCFSNINLLHRAVNTEAGHVFQDLGLFVMQL